MSTTKTTTLAALVLAAGLALTACSNTPAPEPTETTPVQVTPGGETPEPTETPAPEGYTVGQVLTSEPTDLADSQRAFPLPDGTFVVVDRYEAVPDAVQAALNEQATASIPVTIDANTVGAEQATDNAAADMRTAATKATGKDVVVVYQLSGVGACDGAGGLNGWTYLGAKGSFHGGCAVWGTRDAAVAGAQAYVASKADPTTYLIVVKNG